MRQYIYSTKYGLFSVHIVMHYFTKQNDYIFKDTIYPQIFLIIHIYPDIYNFQSLKILNVEMKFYEEKCIFT